jgi:hypothetical protein
LLARVLSSSAPSDVLAERAAQVSAEASFDLAVSGPSQPNVITFFIPNLGDASFFYQQQLAQATGDAPLF